MIIAIDGYSSTGKSTLAKQIAKTLNFIHVDSGAMYRAVTLYALENNLIHNETIHLEELINQLNLIEISFKCDSKTGENRTILNGKDIESEIRGLEVSNNVSLIAKIPEIRAFLVNQQQSMSKQKNVVMDGRDIGTVVFPNADYKFFITADANVRAQRRFKELKETGKVASFRDVLENINTRDKIDANREHSPLKQADDAIVIDNSNLNREETIKKVLSYIKTD